MIAAGVLVVQQVGRERMRTRKEARAARARRLRFLRSGDEVELGEPKLPHKTPPTFKPSAAFATREHHQKFHLFLSHVWGSGQDQMRICKHRLLEMMPDISVFLRALTQCTTHT